MKKAIPKCIYKMVLNYSSSKYDWTCIILYHIYGLNRANISSLKEGSKINFTNLSCKYSPTTQWGHTNTFSSPCIYLVVFSENTKLFILLCGPRGIM